MPGKKKKFNSRFPPARIKKIMQTDEEVGKVAAAVPVIISRGLELFVESLLTRAGEITTARHARTLTPAHLKQCIMADKRFDFLQELVASVADISAEGESDAGPPTPSTPLTPVINMPLQGIGLHSSILTSGHSLSHGDSYPPSPTKTGDDRVEHKSPHGRGRGRGRGRSRGRGQGQGPDSSTVSITRGASRPRGRPRKVPQLLLTTEDLDSDDGLAISVDTDPEENDSETSEDEVTHLDYSGTQCKSQWATESRGVSQHDVENPRFIDDTPKLPGVQITIGEGYSSPLPAGSDNSKINPTAFKIGPPPPLHPLATSNSTPGIQISIPALPTTGDMRTKAVISPVTTSPVSLPNAPLTTNDKPAFGVPVPVITSVHSAKNRVPVTATYSPPSTSIHSHYLVNDEIDEEYDS